MVEETANGGRMQKTFHIEMSAHMYLLGTDPRDVQERVKFVVIVDLCSVRDIALNPSLRKSKT